MFRKFFISGFLIYSLLIHSPHGTNYNADIISKFCLTKLKHLIIESLLQFTKLQRY